MCLHVLSYMLSKKYATTGISGTFIEATGSEVLLFRRRSPGLRNARDGDEKTKLRILHSSMFGIVISLYHAHAD